MTRPLFGIAFFPLLALACIGEAPVTLDASTSGDATVDADAREEPDAPTADAGTDAPTADAGTADAGTDAAAFHRDAYAGCLPPGWEVAKGEMGPLAIGYTGSEITGGTTTTRGCPNGTYALGAAFSDGKRGWLRHVRDTDTKVVHLAYVLESVTADGPDAPLGAGFIATTAGPSPSQQLFFLSYDADAGSFSWHVKAAPKAPFNAVTLPARFEVQADVATNGSLTWTVTVTDRNGIQTKSNTEAGEIAQLRPHFGVERVSAGATSVVISSVSFQ